MSRVFVTGGSGFLGRHILASLVQRGFEVHALTRTVASHEASDVLRWHNADLRDRSSVKALLEQLRPEGLMHLAWTTAHGAYWSSPDNLDWTAMSIQLMRDFLDVGGKRVVLAGSSAEYDWSSGSPLEEGCTPLRPDSLYGNCKNALRQIVEAWAPAAGLTWAWGRIFNIFGPHENAERLVPKVIRTLIEGKELPFDDGSAMRDFLDVRDAADAFAALYASNVQGALNIASGVPVSVRHLVQIIAKTLGKENNVAFGAVPNHQNQPLSVVAAVKRLHGEVRWTPNVSLTEGVKTACDWWQSNARTHGAH